MGNFTCYLDGTMVVVTRKTMIERVKGGNNL